MLHIHVLGLLAPFPAQAALAELAHSQYASAGKLHAITTIATTNRGRHRSAAALQLASTHAIRHALDYSVFSQLRRAASSALKTP